MNQFDFLPLITIGQYYPTGSILHRVDARAKLVVFTGLLIAATFTPSLIGLLCVLVCLLLGIALARVPIKAALKGLWMPLPFLVLIALMQLFFFTPQVDTTMILDWWIFHISRAGIWSAVLMFVRFIALGFCLSLFSFCVSSSELITGLDHLLKPLRRIGIQTTDLVMVVQVTLRFLPLLAISAERIAKAQASRGAEWGTGNGGLVAQVRRVVPLLVPLLLTSLRRSESMALAMDARAYGLKDCRTSLYKLTFTFKDTIFTLLGFLVSVVTVCL